MPTAPRPTRTGLEEPVQPMLWDSPRADRGRPQITPARRPWLDLGSGVELGPTDSAPPVSVVEASAPELLVNETELARVCAAVACRAAADATASSEQGRTVAAGRALDALAQQLDGLGQRVEDELRLARSVAVRVAVAVARTLWVRTSAERLAELEAVVTAMLADLGPSGPIRVLVAPGLVAPMTSLLRDHPATTATAAELVVEADPLLGPVDVRVEWADGWAERSQGRLERMVAELTAGLTDPPDQTMPRHPPQAIAAQLDEGTDE